MNTGEIVKMLAARLGISEKSARLLLRQKLMQMAQVLKHHGAIPMPGFGTLHVSTIKAHRAYNPGKKTYVMMPERQRVSFRTTRGYRDELKDQGEENS